MATGVLVAAVLWLVWLVHFRRWVAHNDFAVLRISLERTLAGHVPTVGAFSRLGVFHPGPLREWAFAGPYWLSGRRAAALPATALVANASWVVWTIVVARSLGHRPAQLAAGAGLVVVVVGCGEHLASPWNPHLAILPLYLACWAAVAVVVRRGEGWPAAVVAASVAAQMHASALPAGAAILAVVAVAVVAWRRTARAAGALAATGIALWLGPLVDLRHGGDANLIATLRARGEGRSVGVGDALGHLSRLLWPPTALAGDAVTPTTDLLAGFWRGWLVLVVVTLAAGVWWAARACRRAGVLPVSSPAAVAPALALALLVVAAASVAAFVQPVYRYLFGPLGAVAVFALAAVVAAYVPEAALAAGWGRRAAPWAAALGAVVVAVTFATVPADDHESAGRRALGVEPAVAAALEARPGWRQVEVVGADLRGASVDAEVADVALRHGRDVRSTRFGIGLPAPEGGEPVLAAAMGPARGCLLDAPGAALVLDGVIATTGDPVAVFAIEPGTAGATCL